MNIFTVTLKKHKLLLVILSGFALTALVGYFLFSWEQKLSRQNNISVNKPILHSEAEGESRKTSHDHILPPDPGDEGKATVAGIDSDNDGVRDDVQRSIFLSYKDPTLRSALMQQARAMQKYLLDAHDQEKTITHAQELRNASACLRYVTNTVFDDDASIQNLVSIRNKLRDQLLNTPLRKEVARTAYEQTIVATFQGIAITESEHKLYCQFNADMIVEN